MLRQSSSYEVEAEEPLPRDPGQRLLTAILVRAIRDFVNYREASKGTDSIRIAEDAAGWIFWDGKEDMTFRHVCTSLNMNYRDVRRRILTLTKEDLVRMTPPENDEAVGSDEDED
jgi:hypothetical protein